MLGFFKQKCTVLVLLLKSCSGSLATECVSMNKQRCMVRLILNDLNPDEFHYYPFIISMNGCNGSCNTVEDPFGRI